MIPEEFLPEIENLLDPAEQSWGCLLPVLDDPAEGGEDESQE